jgi:hypothetical protein
MRAGDEDNHRPDRSYGYLPDLTALVVCTENFIRVDDAPESPKLAE